MGGFWIQFSASLLAEIVGAAVLSLILFEVFKKFFSPTITLRAKQHGVYTKELAATKLDDGCYEVEFGLAVKNKSNRTFLPSHGGYWHIAVPHDHIKIIEATCEYDDDDKTLTSFIDRPVMPRSFLDTGCKIKLHITPRKVPQEKERGLLLYWYMTTDKGYYPRSVKVDAETGQVIFRTMGRISIELPV